MHLPFTTTIDLQNEVEREYSYKHVRSYVLNDIDKESNVYNNCKKAVYTYMCGTYYPSKQKRICELKLKHSIDNIVIELFIAILPLTIMTPIQSISALMTSRLELDDHIESIKTMAEIVAVCESTGLYTIYHNTNPENDTDTLTVHSRYSLDPHTIKLINKTKYLPPMVCEPDEWQNYITQEDYDKLNNSKLELESKIKCYQEKD